MQRRCYGAGFMSESFPQRQLERLLRRLHDEVIGLNTDLIHAIVDRGAVACAVLDVSPEAKTALRALGWDGASVVFELDHIALSRLARAFESDGRKAGAHWLRTRRGRRVLLFLSGATVCFNLSDDGEMTVAPGTLAST